MKRFFRILSIALLCGALSAPVISAQRHGGNNGGRERTTHSNSSNRGNSGSRNNGSRHNATRPNNNGGSTGRPGLGNKRPNNNKDHGINNGNHDKPNYGKPNKPNNGNHNWGNNHRPDNRPGNSFHPNDRPHRPGVGHHPVHRPPLLAPPHRPHRPNMYRPHYRPTPPPRWRPARGIPAIRGILGITFGTGISLSLDYLYNSGFVVDGYNNDVVYLRNVNQLNYIWTDAALYYGANGLDASSFYYATPAYDLSRYNAVYNNLISLYGQPVSINTVGQLGATWFGGNQGYITLTFGASNVAGGALRYLTTLTFGL